MMAMVNAQIDKYTDKSSFDAKTAAIKALEENGYNIRKNTSGLKILNNGKEMIDGERLECSQVYQLTVEFDGNSTEEYYILIDEELHKMTFENDNIIISEETTKLEDSTINLSVESTNSSLNKTSVNVGEVFELNAGDEDENIVLKVTYGSASLDLNIEIVNFPQKILAYWVDEETGIEELYSMSTYHQKDEDGVDVFTAILVPGDYNVIENPDLDLDIEKIWVSDRGYSKDAMIILRSVGYSLDEIEGPIQLSTTYGSEAIPLKWGELWAKYIEGITKFYIIYNNTSE